MDYKIPFLVSLLALAGSLYWGFSQRQITTEAPPDCSECLCLSDKPPISPTTANQWIENYTEYLDSINIEKKKPKLEEAVAGKKFKMPQNEYIRRFQLPPCELETMASSIAEGAHVYAILVAKEFQYDNKPYYGIDLLFKGKLASDSPYFGNAKFVDDDGNGYYDFSNPCPPLCEED